MTNEEFSNEFDILVNSSSISKPFGLGTSSLEFDEYEKSVFLTKAQESVITSLYNGKLVGESFETSEELRRQLSNLIRTYTTNTEVEGNGLTDNSHFFNIPKDVWVITYENVKSKDENLSCAKGAIMEVVPVTQDELYKTIRNPFRGPNKRRVLRLDNEENNVELISNYKIFEYQIRYLIKPEPIILIDLPDGLSINGATKITECKLTSVIHRIILEAAVNLALKSRVITEQK